MAPVYADQPFALIPTPAFLAKSENAQPDLFDNLASEMTNVHNLITRGLNSIYLQAPHIKPADEKSFCHYIGLWYSLVHSHHEGEETMFFPTVEKMTGVKGIMENNLEQHKAFHHAVDDFKAYADAVVAGKEVYDGNRVVTMIDGFGDVLVRHLNDEIPSILGLRTYGDKMAGLDKVFDEEGEKAMKEMGTSGLLFAFANLDIHYENDMWLSWPPAPLPVKVVMRSIFWWMHADVRKFGAVDRMGNLKHLYAVPQAS